MTDLPRDQLQATLGTAYTLERELGGGGMSRVFVAREEALGRDVVVKVLAPELAEGLSAERFAREIRLAAALQEPHIVPVLTAGVTADGLPFYSMPFVRGESLRARLAQGAVLATLYGSQGRPDLREAELRQTVTLEPLSGLFLSQLASLVASAGRTGEARLLARRAVALDPLNRAVLNNAALALTWTGDFAEALAIIDRAAYSPREAAYRRVLPLVGLGRRDSAERIARRFRATVRTADDYRDVAFLEAALGNVDAAFAALERSTGMPADSPLWKQLARDPRYVAICRRRLDPGTCARKVQTLEAFSPIPPPASPR